MLVALACVVLIYLKGRAWREKRARKMEAAELAAKEKEKEKQTEKEKEKSAATEA